VNQSENKNFVLAACLVLTLCISVGVAIPYYLEASRIKDEYERLEKRTESQLAEAEAKIEKLKAELNGEYISRAKWLLREAIDRGEYSYQLDPKTGEIHLWPVEKKPEPAALTRRELSEHQVIVVK